MQVTNDIDQVEVVQLLLQLGDLKRLGDVALLELANTAQIQKLSKGDLLSAEQQLNRHLYLIAGEIELSANGKDMQHIVASTERALMPLFRVHTHGLIAKCLSPVQLLSLNEDVVKRYVASINPRESSGIQLEEYSETNQEASIIAEIRHIFHHNEVDLPSLPEVALRVNRAVIDPNQNLRSLSLEIQTDPMIAARVVQVANSALYKTPQHIDSIQDAVSRIGTKALQSIVMSVVLRNLFKPKSHPVHKRTRIFYLHSIRVASISQILARHLSGFDPEHAFLAGLLHDVGVMPILILADQRAELAENPEMLEHVIQETGGLIGGILLRQWGFSGDLLTVAEEAQYWQRKPEKADYCDLIQIAQLHCHLFGGNKLDAPEMSELPAFARLHLQAIDPVAVIHEARDEIHEIVSLFTL
jgi:HD-like signal output (HDOD) protein